MQKDATAKMDVAQNIVLVFLFRLAVLRFVNAKIVKTIKLKLRKKKFIKFIRPKKRRKKN